LPALRPWDMQARCRKGGKDSPVMYCWLAERRCDHLLRLPGSSKALFKKRDTKST
jgi:hypothetical protein